MLSRADISIASILPIFVDRGIEVAVLVPTPTGLGKGYFDATWNVRSLFKHSGYHDYAQQGQGAKENGIHKKAHLVYADKIVDTDASIYRPKTKHGDPRIWLGAKVKKYCIPFNTFVFAVKSDELYVFNMSDPKLVCALTKSGTVANDVLIWLTVEESTVAKELLEKLKDIHHRGYIPSVTKGDTGVGMTLEHCLGITPNSRREPDYKGIELKAKRTQRSGKSSTLQTLFTKTPDWERSPLDARGLLTKFGYYPKNSSRLTLHCTVKATDFNPQGLSLSVREPDDDLATISRKIECEGDVAYWSLSQLKSQLVEKHAETFWISAESKNIDGREHFLYKDVIHTFKPLVNMFDSLIESGIVSVDFAMYKVPDRSEFGWRVRDHGYLFRIAKKHMNLLFPKEVHHDLADLESPARCPYHGAYDPKGR